MIFNEGDEMVEINVNVIWNIILLFVWEVNKINVFLKEMIW